MVSGDGARSGRVVPYVTRPATVRQETSMTIPTLTEAASSAASTLHENADRLPGGESVARAAHTAADAIQTSADYFEDRDPREMLEDLRQMAMRHPGATLLTAVALGFLLARSLSRH
jgi:hypothetical protein